MADGPSTGHLESQGRPCQDRQASPAASLPPAAAVVRHRQEFCLSSLASVTSEGQMELPVLPSEEFGLEGGGQCPARLWGGCRQVCSPGLARLRPCAQGRDRAPASVYMCVIHFPAWLGVAEASPLYLTDNYAKINVAALPFSHRVCWEGCGLLGSGRPGRWPLTHTHARGGGGGYKGALSTAELLDPGAPLLQGDSQGQWLP